MKTPLRLLPALALAALACATTPALAEIPNSASYIGLSAGGNLVLGQWDIAETDALGVGVAPGGSAIFKLRGGYQPVRWFALEFGIGALPAPADDQNFILTYEADALIQPFDFGKLTPFLDVGLGFYHNVTADGGGGDLDPQLHWGIGVRYMVLDRLALRAEARHVMTDGLESGSMPFASNLELTVGVDFFFLHGGDDSDGDGIADDKDACPNTAGQSEALGCPDRDRDTIADRDDRCPDVPGTAAFEGCIDSDGDGISDADDRCPKIAGKAEYEGCLPPDADGDGILDADDACPEVSGPAEHQGCPPSDRDEDGILDSLDTCPEIAGVASASGCPDGDGDGVRDSEDACPEIAGPAETKGCPDSDGDGVVDASDKCPEISGTAEWKGCAPPSAEVLEKFSGSLEGIKFKSGSSKIDPSSAPVLEDAAKTLKAWPGVRVMIEGHTDDQGRAESNLKLSEARATSVRAYLVDQGVPAEQMEARGQGEEKPIADNTTAEGRRQNRRIEFNILKD